jgi:hypothetical protein
MTAGRRLMLALAAGAALPGLVQQRLVRLVVPYRA